jgi:hypothetical protein
LVSLLLPGVNSAREAGRRTQCLNNLHQIAIAIQQYEAEQGTLPASGLNPIVTVKDSVGYYTSANALPQGPDLLHGTMFSWAVLTLPYAEEQSLYKSIDFARTVFDQPNDAPAAQPSVLLCPSDGARGRYFLHNGKQLGKANYAAYVSPVHVDYQLIFPGALITTGQRNADIADGTTLTIMLAEIRTREDPQDQRGAWALAWTGSSLLAFDMHPLMWSWGQASTSDGRFVPNELWQMFQLDYMACESYAEAGWLSAAPRSNHASGVNVVFADAHTHFLRNGIDELVMAYLISANDRHTIDPSKY